MGHVTEPSDPGAVARSSVRLTRSQVEQLTQALEGHPGSVRIEALADAHVVVDMIIQNASAEGITDISFTVLEADLAKSLEICGRIKEDLGAKSVSGTEDIAKVSIIGIGMRSYSGVASTMFSALAKEGINIEMISTSEIKISCVIQQKYAELAVRTLHDVFELEKAS